MNNIEEPKYSIENKDSNEFFECPFDYNPKATKDLDSLVGDLSTDEIFRITLWKINRYIEDANDVAYLVNSSVCVKDLRQTLEELLKKKGVGLPMASTYLRFRDPNRYQIIDVRAFRMAFDFLPEEFDNHYKCFPSLGTAGYEVYYKYLERLKTIATNGYHGITVNFSNLDRFLYDVDKAFGHKIKDGEGPSEDWKDLLKSRKNEQANIIIEKIRKYKNGIVKVQQ